MNNDLLLTAQSPQGLKGVVVLTHNIFEMNYHAINVMNNDLLSATQSPQGLKRCADAQHFWKRRNVFLRKIFHKKYLVAPKNRNIFASES